MAYDVKDTFLGESREKYFAAQDSKEAAGIILGKAVAWFQQIESNQYLEKTKQCWANYHGAFFTDTGSGHQVVFGGEQGEMTMLAVNHFRNLAQHMITMTTASRPSLQARATNTDYKSIIQTKLANGLLDYYMREKRLEINLKSAVEYAVVMGSGYIKMDWNATSGDVYDFNEETQTNIYQGDVDFINLAHFDVVFDSTKEYGKHDWTMCRSFKNKFDLAAKYPEFHDKIVRLPTKSDVQRYRFDLQQYEDTDDVPIYEFYHNRTDSMPDGRYLYFISPEIILNDSPMPYRKIPIYRIAPAEILGTPYGYTPMFDIMPLQDAINSMYSTILTNNNAFGVQNVWVPRGSEISTNQIAGGLNVIEGNSQFGPPQALNLTNTSPEVYKFLEILERVSETISGINSVARGNPIDSLKSGNALALVQSQALQFISGLQQSYIMLMEDVGTGLINMLKDFASVPRVAAIAGKANKSFMKEFVGDDLSTVNRVIVDVGNPLSKTTAGKLQIAESLLQMGLIKTPEQYFNVLNTGEMDLFTDSIQNELFTMKLENEQLMDGEDAAAIATDDHPLHIKEHKTVLSDPQLRKDPQLVARVLSHIQQHIDLMRSVDPSLLQIIGVQPLSPLGGSPVGPQGQPPGPQGSADGTQGPNATPQAASVQAAPDVSNVGLPKPAVPPAPFQSAPTTAVDSMAAQQRQG